MKKAQRYKQYLLGILPENKIEVLESKLKSDEKLVKELRNSESKLIEDFFAESLTLQERELFYRNYLVSDEREQRFKEIAALREKNSGKKETLPVSEIEENEINVPKIITFFALNRQPSTAILSFLILVIAGILIWQTFFQNRSTATNVPQNSESSLRK